MDRFLLAYNPLKHDKTYILHTVFPRILIECSILSETEAKIDETATEIREIFEIHRFENSLYELKIIHYYDNTGILQVKNDMNLVKKYYKIVERSWRWYHIILKEKKI